jgi:nitrogen fixation NifU-like protein
MSEALYNERIIGEAKAGIGAGRLEAPTVSVRCDNPLCGDRTTLELAIEGGRIARAAHQTRGCLLTRAAASVLARHLEGAEPGTLAGVRAAVEAILKGGGEAAPWPELAMFAPVAAVRSRHECVLLPFRALEEALSEAERP